MPFWKKIYILNFHYETKPISNKGIFVQECGWCDVKHPLACAGCSKYPGADMMGHKKMGEVTNGKLSIP